MRFFYAVAGTDDQAFEPFNTIDLTGFNFVRSVLGLSAVSDGRSANPANFQQTSNQVEIVDVVVGSRETLNKGRAVHKTHSGSRVGSCNLANSSRSL